VLLCGRGQDNVGESTGAKKGGEKDAIAADEAWARGGSFQNASGKEKKYKKI